MDVLARSRRRHPEARSAEGWRLRDLVKMSEEYSPEEPS